MAVLSQYARKKKIQYFLNRIPKDARILEIGSQTGWVGDYFYQHGWSHHIGLDLTSPADIVGDIRNWRALHLDPQSFDVIVAFEVVEHVDCFRECYELLKPGGMLMITSPLPQFDWLARALELFGLSQPRTSPHDHLIRFERIPFFEKRELKIVGLISQWGILTKTGSSSHFAAA